MNHMAIVVISQFGNFFYMASTEREWKELIGEQYLKIQTTTSSAARYKIDGNKIELQKAEQKMKNEAQKATENNEENKSETKTN